MIPVPPNSGGPALAELAVIGPPVEAFAWLSPRAVGGARVRRGLLVRDGEGPRAYFDACPHWGTPLAAGAAPQLHDGHLLCAAHGALFRARDGYCVSGPCEGASLRPLVVDRLRRSLRIRLPDGALDSGAEP
ncbi:MAG: Rieske (2Fe-2S) protein [Myxococcales bacterium]|nr:Rieske (2Fe-2S) protein [Myxococcales bacterium]MCB9520235.1 Rieske (2Fe-2S) protein [Myxococcales bacterium]MCB9531397.1 Rieske (2Fe-2S) protein [Myxococcales bacterium]MCB9533530.1 Rieske (2Fe-2S) protein [Myxococcales bacterium]